MFTFDLEEDCEEYLLFLQNFRRDLFRKSFGPCYEGQFTYFEFQDSLNNSDYVHV